MVIWGQLLFNKLILYISEFIWVNLIFQIRQHIFSPSLPYYFHPQEGRDLPDIT